MKYKTWFFLTICLLVLTACMRANPVESPPAQPQPDDFSITPPTPGREEPPLNPYSPGKGDESMQRGEVYIDSTDILILESFPLQFQLNVKGSLPTPCHQLRVVVDEPDEKNQIHVLLYSLVDPTAVCTQVLEPFEVNIPLGSFTSGSYTIFVNDEKIGEITP